MTENRKASGWFYLFLLALLAGVGKLLLATAVMGEDHFIPLVAIGGIATAVVLRGPIGKALARRLEGGTATEGLPEHVPAELEELRNRVLELEERVDFAERLLARPQLEAERVERH
jgi:hypothetical protein